MWPFKSKTKVLEKPRYRFRDGRLILSTLPPGRTEGQRAVWRQEVACLEIEYNGHPLLGLGGTVASVNTIAGEE